MSVQTPKPFWRADGSDARRPRLLLVSYHFPPGQATGALRWQKLSRFAWERGFELDVVTVLPEYLERIDERRLLDLPPGTRIFGSAHPQPRFERAAERVSRLRRALRPAPAAAAGGNGAPTNDPPRVDLVFREQLGGWSLRPRALLRALGAWRSLGPEDVWAREALRVGRTVVDPERHCAVISCGPPHAAHDAARRIAAGAGLPLVVDMRDPWSLVPAVEGDRASPLFYHIVERRERLAVEQAALIVVNTPVHATALAARYPAAADRIQTVLNGADGDAVPPLRAERFTIAYAGSIYIDRDPRPIFRAAARLVRSRALTPAQFAIEFLGNVNTFAGSSVQALAAETGLSGYVHLHPPRPRAEALEFLARAPMLLSLPQDVDVSIPSKVYEYMQFEAWLLALANAGSATERVLRETGADVVAPDDEDAIAAVMASRFAEFASGVRPPRLIDRNPGLTRERQAAMLFDALESRLGIEHHTEDVLAANQ